MGANPGKSGRVFNKNVYLNIHNIIDQYIVVDTVKGIGLLFLGPCILRLPDLSIKYFDIFYTGEGLLNCLCPTGSAHRHGFSNLPYQAKI